MNISRYLMPVTLLCLSAASSAQRLIVLDDQGGRPFALHGKTNREGISTTPPRGISFKQSFPVRTAQLSPGELVTTPVPSHKGQWPVFVIGNDAFSLGWIEVNKNYLVELGAKGFVVSVASEAEWLELKDWLAPLDVKAVPGDAFHEVFGITHYPFLLKNGEALQ